MDKGTILESFRVLGNLFSLKALLIHFFSSLKQKSDFFSISTGIYPSVALSEGKFYPTAFTVSTETKWTEKFLFIFVIFIFSNDSSGGIRLLSLNFLFPILLSLIAVAYLLCGAVFADLGWL